MIKVVVLLACCVAGLSAAFPYWPWSGFPYWNAPYYNPYYWYYNYPAGVYGVNYAASGQKQAYYGEFRGTCDGSQDGLYYIDDRSFAYCSGGQKTIQPCPEGTSNPPVTAFTAGELYGFFDFCSINLLAHGYYPFAAPVAAAGKQYGHPPPPTESNYNDKQAGKAEPPKDKY